MSVQMESSRPPVPSTMSSKPGLLNLPPEILCMVLEYLELHDEFLVSHTCKHLEKFTKRELDVWKGLTHRNRRFWTGLSYLMPRHFACRQCYSLHRIHRLTMPWADRRTWQDLVCQAPRADDPPYVLRHEHIEAALKLIRLRDSRRRQRQQRQPTETADDGDSNDGDSNDGDSDDGDSDERLLDNIMRPFMAHKWISEGVFRLEGHNPKIVKGRFMMHKEVKYYSFNNFTSPITLQTILRGSTVCPHIQPSRFIPGLVLPGPLTAEDQGRDTFYIRAAFELVSLNGKKQGFCSRCPTDYDIVRDDSGWTINRWTDFGPFGPAADIERRVHVYSPKNNHDIGPTVYHRPGSVWSLYELGRGDGPDADNWIQVDV